MAKYSFWTRKIDSGLVCMGQNSSRVQMASGCHLCAAVLVHVARRRKLDSDLNERSFSYTGWCKSRGTVFFLSSVETEMTDTIEIGLKIRLQHLRNQKYIVLKNIYFISNYLQLWLIESRPPFCRSISPAFLGAADMCDRFECV